jgi:FKBP-type peptidyl-prolyl cis-trans isomerase FkpA
MIVRNSVVLACAVAMLSFGCGCNSRSHNNKKETGPSNPNEIREPSINTNKTLMKKESDDIDQYVKRHGWDSTMQVSGTGLRYMIYEKGKGPQAEKGRYATVKYKITLLDGRECYSSEKDGPKEFLIGQDNVESGLHEGVALLHVGDKAIFILPSHLAHGLMGDNNKIPPRSSVVYDIELTALR